VKSGPSSYNFLGGEQFDLNRMFLRGTQHTGHNCAVLRTDFNQANLLEQFPTSNGLKPMPKPIRLFQQRYVIGMLEIRLSNDARLAMRRRRAGSESAVMARNDGTAANGSTRKKMELNATSEN